MALEDLTGPNKFVANLVPTNPTATDPISQGDNHIQGIKNVLLNTFPGLAGSSPQVIPNILQFAAATDAGSSTGSLTFVSANNSSILFTPRSATSKLLIECNFFSNVSAAAAPASAIANYGLAVNGVAIGTVESCGWSAVGAGGLTGFRVPAGNSAIYNNVSLAAVAIVLQHLVSSAGVTVSTTGLVFRITEYV